MINRRYFGLGQLCSIVLGVIPSQAQPAPEAPFPEVTDVDHARLIRSWNDGAFERGKKLYNTVCFACHGIDGKKVTVEGARAFAVDPLAKGSDPYSLFKVITFGYATMPQQQWMTPGQRYDVVHYIREAFLRESNPTQYTKVDEDWLKTLPKPTAKPGPELKKDERDYGPVLCTNLNRDYSVVLNHRLPGEVTVSYDLHRMQLAGLWTGGFLDLKGTRMHRQRGEAPAKPGGTMVEGLQTWKWAYEGSFDYGDLPPRSPAPEKFMRYFGHYVHGDQAVMSYSVAGANILEMPTAGQEDGRLVVRHHLQVGPGSAPLKLCVAELESGRGAILPVGTAEAAGAATAPAQEAVAVLAGDRPKPRRDAGRALFVASPDQTRKSLAMADKPFGVAVRFRTEASGTLVAVARPEGGWIRDGKSLFVRGDGRLVYDIGWLGEMRSRQRVNDGKWHWAVLAVSDGTARLFIDGKLQAERREFSTKHVRRTVFKIGQTATNFGGNLDGEIQRVLYFDRALDEAQCVELASGKSPAGLASSFTWSPGGKAPATPEPQGPMKFYVSAAVTGDTEGLRWEVVDGRRLVLHIAPSGKKRSFQVRRHSGEGDASFAAFSKSLAEDDGKVVDLDALTKGGPNRFPQPLTVNGALGEAKNGYALDTIPVPFDNPYNAWLRTSALAFFPDGRCVVVTYTGDVWIVSGIDEGLAHVTWQRFAGGMYEPFGVLVIDGVIHVTCRDGIKRLHDFNNDGYADYHETFFADPDVSTFFHAFCFDLQRDSKGYLYYSKSGQYTDFKQPGAVVKVAPDGRSFEYFATGFRTPNGMGMMPDDVPLCSDNQGNWMPANKISLCRRGGSYGYVQTHGTGAWAPDGGKIDHREVVPPETFDQPILWLPNSEDNSPGAQLWLDDERAGPLRGKGGRLMHSSFGKGKVYYLMLQEVGGVTQSACVTLPHQWDAGVQRLRLNPVDGQLYGVGLSGWQGPRGGKDGCLQRLRYTGEECRLIDDVQVRARGIELRFNFDVDREAAADPGNYQLEMWNYDWKPQYGSPNFSVRNPGKRGTDKLVVRKVHVAPDGRRVLLELEDLVPCQQLRARMKLKAADGRPFEDGFYQTIHRIPER